MHLGASEYLLGIVAAYIIGFSKTGMPGTGILMVPIMAAIFGGRLSVGATLPLLVLADCFAVAFYRVHAQWRHLQMLAPWVMGGLLAGTALLDYLGGHVAKKDYLGMIIGGLVLLMLSVSLLRGKIGEKLVPTSTFGRGLTGIVAGFSTMVSNAAGPVMAIYMTSTGMAKEQLMGTNAWYFFIFNIVKLPFLAWVTMRHPNQPMFNHDTMMFDLIMVPVILIGAYSGKWLLPHIPQKPFNNTVIVLAAFAAFTLFIPK